MTTTRRSWTKEDTYALIEEYEQNAMLWNTKSEGYRNRNLKNKALSTIALKFNCTVGEIQRKLHNLRNQVSQELNKIKKKKSEGVTDEVCTSTWTYFSALKFLMPDLINRSAILNNEDEEEDTPYDSNNDEIEETEGNTNEQMQRTIKQEKLEKKGTKRKYTFDDDNSKIFKRALEIIHKEPDESDRFGEYVAMELKSLQFDSNKRRLKSEIRKAIVRIADEDDAACFSSVPVKFLS